MKVAAKIAILLPVVLAAVGYASFGRAQDKKEAPAAAPGGASAASAASSAKSAADLPPANPKDVESLDAIVTAVYDVISGPPGPRDWNRFNSLFAADARLIAVRTPKDGGKPSLVVMTPKGYEE